MLLFSSPTSCLRGDAEMSGKGDQAARRVCANLGCSKDGDKKCGACGQVRKQVDAIFARTRDFFSTCDTHQISNRRQLKLTAAECITDCVHVHRPSTTCETDSQSPHIRRLVLNCDSSQGCIIEVKTCTCPPLKSLPCLAAWKDLPDRCEHSTAHQCPRFSLMNNACGTSMMIDSQVFYCSAECQRAHWKEKVGGHKVVCKATQAAQSSFASAYAQAVASAAASGSDGDGPCIICLENDPQPIQSGCACRGHAGLAHIECRIKVAEHAQQSSTDYWGAKEWTECGTCHQIFSNAMGLGIDLKRWLQSLQRSEVDYDRVLAMMSMSQTLIGCSKFVEAESISREAAALAFHVCGDNGPRVALDATFQVGTALMKQGEFHKAEPILRECHKMSVDINGSDHSTTVSRADHLGKCLWSMDRYAEALAIFQPNFVVCKRMYGQEGQLTLMAAMDVAKCLTALRMLDDALTVLSKYVPIFKRVLGPEHALTLQICADYACTIALSGRCAEGEAMLVETIAVQTRVLGYHHTMTRRCMADLGDLRTFARCGVVTHATKTPLGPASTDPPTSTQKNKKKGKK